MGCVAASFVKTAHSDKWAELGRGPNLRLFFGAYGSQDCWAVQRRYRQIDDGDGFVSYDQLRQLVGAEEFHLLFLWDLFSLQNELIDVKELMVVICLFSSARLEEKAKFLLALFDESKCSITTGRELAQLCFVMLSVFGRCIGASAVRLKELGHELRVDLPNLVPAYAEAVNLVGADNAFSKERVIHHSEVDRLLCPIRSAYERLSVARAPPKESPPPPPPEWGIDAAGAVERRSKRRPLDESISKELGKATIVEPEAHLAWLKKLGQEEEDCKVASEQEDMSIRRWMLLHGTEFASVASRLTDFEHSFDRSLTKSLGLSRGCVQLVCATVGPWGGGSTLLEFILHSSGNGADGRRPVSEFLGLLDIQLASKHSALRCSEIGSFLQDAELLTGRPQRGGVLSSGAPVETQTQATQTEAAELCQPWPMKRPAAPRSAMDPSAVELASKTRAAMRALEQVRKRADEAEAKLAGQRGLLQDAGS